MVAAVTVRKNGMAEMAYVGEKPWHGLGQSLQEGAAIETWRRAAGMDWTVQRGLVRYATSRDGDLAIRSMSDKHVLFRSDTKEALGIVSPKYNVVQPAEVLEFFRDLTEANGFVMNTAGTLFDGRRFWALAKIGKDAVVVGEDRVGGYLLLSTSCDGTLATTAKFTTVRVVCNNTLSMALSATAREDVIVRHNTKFNADEAKQSLGIARDNFAEFLKAARHLAKVPVTTVQAGTFVESLLTDTKTVLKDDVRQSKQFLKILELFNGSAMGGTLLGAQGTAWGLVNGVTEFVDHHARAKTDSHRLATAWFGRGDELKTEALERALAL